MRTIALNQLLVEKERRMDSCTSVQHSLLILNEQKTISLAFLFKRKPFDGKNPHSFKDLFFRVHH